MPLEAVIAELAEEHKVEKVGGASWLVMPKDGTLYPAVGSVDFKNDKVRKVRKYWGPEDQARGVEFATNLYGLIESFTEEGKRNCVISVGETHDPGYENRTAFISCGHKRIEISITRSDKLAGPAATVDEVLEDR